MSLSLLDSSSQHLLNSWVPFVSLLKEQHRHAGVKDIACTGEKGMLWAFVGYYSLLRAFLCSSKFLGMSNKCSTCLSLQGQERSAVNCICSVTITFLSRHEDNVNFTESFVAMEDLLTITQWFICKKVIWILIIKHVLWEISQRNMKRVKQSRRTMKCLLDLLESFENSFENSRKVIKTLIYLLGT